MTIRVTDDLIEQAALAVAAAGICGIGDYDADGKWVRRLCDDKAHVPSDLLCDECQCRVAAKAAVEYVAEHSNGEVWEQKP